MRRESTISTLTIIRSVQPANQDSDRQRIFVLIGNLKLVERVYTSLYGICTSAR